MKRYHVRDILAMSEKEVEVDDTVVENGIEVEFDDGEVVETYWATLPYMWIVWEPFRHFPKARILKNTHPVDKPLMSSTHLNLLTNIYEEIINCYGGEALNAEVQGMLNHVIQNVLYNWVSHDLGAFVTSISLVDFIELNKNEAIVNTRKRLLPNNKSIIDVQDSIYQIILTDKSLDNNSIAVLARSGGARAGNVKHVCGPMGKRTDVDGKIFDHPVMNSIYHGLNSYEALIESRSTSKSLNNNKSELPSAEYFQRRIQMTMYYFYNDVGKITDCGTTRTSSFDITHRNWVQFQGKFHYDTEKACYTPLTAEALKAKIGQTVAIRGVDMCRVPNGACRTCFGLLADAIPANTVAGHASEVEAFAPPSQDILSTKHNDMVAGVVIAILNERDKLYLSENEDTAGLDINEDLLLKYKKVELSLPTKPLHLTDVKTNDVSRVKPEKVSSIQTLTFLCYDEDDALVDTHTITIVEGADRAYFTVRFLRYIKENGWGEVGPRTFIDLTGWPKYLNRCIKHEELNGLPTNRSVVTIPMTSNDAVEFSKAYVKVIINSRDEERQGSTRGDKPVTRFKGMVIKPLSSFGEDREGALKHIFELFSLTRHRVNIVHFETLIRCLLCVDPENGNYDIPSGDELGVVTPYDRVAKYRSIGQSSAYGYHKQLHTDPSQFLIESRPHNALDQMLVGAKLNEFG